MKVLIGCEFTGIFRDAFRARGHDAWSCDTDPCEGDPTYHLQCDVRELLTPDWDLAIFHPPCTHLAVSGARWFKDKQEEQAEALEFVQTLLNAPIEKIALENPVSIISSRIRKPDQWVHPYWFGEPEFKKTCWWLKNLPKLKATDYAPNPQESTWRMAPSDTRGKDRSRSFKGMAEAAAAQWG